MKKREKRENRPVREMEEVRRLPAEAEEWKARALKSENALRESRETHRTLLKNSPQKLFYKDTNSAYILCSESFAANLKIGMEEIRGKTDYDFFPKELADKYVADDRRIMLSGRAETIEERYPQGGEEHIVSTYKAPVRDDRGEIVGILGIFSDITARKKAEESLQKSEERLKIVFELVPDGIYICDGRGIFVDGNTAAERLVGYGRGELIGKSFIDLHLFPTEELTRADAILQKTLAGSPAGPEELTLIQRDGSRLVVEVRSFPIELGGEIMALGIVRDITERRRSEEMISRLNRCFLSLGSDSRKNIESLVITAGEILSGACMLYNRLERERGMLCTWGIWQEPPGYESDDAPEGHICYDVIKEGREEPVIIEDLTRTKYTKTDPNVKKYKLKSYLGVPVKMDGEVVGSFCLCDVVKRKFTEREVKVAVMLARAVGIEEERKQAAEKARAQHREFLAVFEGIDEVIYVSDPASYEILYINNACRAMFGDVIGHTCYKALQNRSAPCPFCTNDLIFGEYMGKSYVRDFQNENNRRWYHCIDRAIPWPDGRIVRYEMAVDITDRKEAEEKYKNLFRASRDAIMTLDPPEWNFTSGNPAAIQMFKAESEEDFCSRPPWQYSPEKQPDGQPSEIQAKKMIEKAMEAGSNFYEWTHRRLGGEDFPATVLLSRMEQGGKKFLQATVRDITKSKKMEEQLLHAQKMEAVGTLAGGMAHDFNNILAGILGYASLVKKNMGKENPLNGDIAAIERLSWRGADLTEALLAFSRKGKYRPESLRVHGIIDEVLKIIGKTAGSGIDIRAELAPDVFNIIGDRSQMHQMLMNLCINACESMPGGGALTVRAGNAELDESFFRIHPEMRGGSYVAILVTDTGSGMDADTMKRIFDPFFTTKEEKSGTGLGLAMVSGIVSNHGGCVEVQSSPGAGSTFVVHLPATREKEREAVDELEVAVMGDETILLVDDEDDFRVTTGRHLKDLGYTVVAAPSGKEALEILEKKKDEVDLVVLDMVMKGMGGAETFREMRKMVANLPVILCTGYALHETARELLEEMPADFVQKPLEIDSLASKIRKLLSTTREKR